MRSNRSVLNISLLSTTIVILLAAGLHAQAQTASQPNRWEPNIQRFEERDRQTPPPTGAILFLGSSSIVGWDLERCFPDRRAINRGFGGSQIVDSLHFTDRIVLPYRPKTIVFYAGDNDIASGKSPKQVLADYKQFVEKVHEGLPKTRIIFVAIKPSISRWNLVDKIREANAKIRIVAEKDPRLIYLDIDKPMLGKDGKPRPEIFKDDGLHLNDEGYKLWSDLLRPHLTAP
ncbi:MAG: SGNH/GDSL hydrolase family protein [Thermoguttaceae bacterium]